MKQAIKLNKFSVAALSILVAVTFAGCGRLDFTKSLLNATGVSQASTAQGIEVVSGASTGQLTLINGYLVNASVGAVRDKLQSTTVNGYTVYDGVRGAIISDQGH